MRIIVQRSLQSNVKVSNEIVGSIDKGYVLLVGFTHQDTIEDIDYLVKKINSLRIFDDENGNMNLSINDVNGSILSISQFTLYGNAKNGNRPSFTEAMKYDEASKMYDIFNDKLIKAGLKVEKGIFGADMEVEITNDGPVTIILESR